MRTATDQPARAMWVFIDLRAARTEPFLTVGGNYILAGVQKYLRNRLEQRSYAALSHTLQDGLSTTFTNLPGNEFFLKKIYSETTIYKLACELLW